MGAGKPVVEPGEFITVRVDMTMGNDLSTAGAIGVFQEIGAARVFDPERIVIVLDHIVPAKDIQAATLLKGVREWVREQRIPHFYGIREGDVVSVDLPKGVILNETTGATYHVPPLSPVMQELMAAGGLVNYARKRLGRA